MLQPEPLHYRKLWLTLGFCLVLLIAYKSLEPIEIVVEGFEHFDLLLHFLAYLALAGWFQQLYTRQSLIPIAITVAIFSALLELGQSFVPVRETNISDFLTNVSAIALATLLNSTGLQRTLKFFEQKYLPA